MARPFLSIIIPAYNEAKRLPLMLVDLDYHLAKAEYSYEILVIDDGSTDATADIVSRFALLIPGLKLIKSPMNQGKGAAVKIGMLTAKGTWRLQMDADNNISIVEFQKMLPHLGKGGDGYDILLASRSARGTRIKPPMPFHRRLTEWSLNKLIRWCFFSGVRDFLFEFQCFSAVAAEKVFSATSVKNFAYGAEALIVGERLGYRAKEIPVFAMHTEQGSHVRFRHYLQILGEVIKLRWRLKKTLASLV